MATTYATISDVNALVPQSPFTATTVPSQAQVETYLRQCSQRVEAICRNLGYVLPITGAESLLLVKEAVAWGALGLAQQARVTGIEADGSMGFSVWTKMFLDWLDRLGSAKDPFELPDAPRTGREVVKPIGRMMEDSTSLDTHTYIDSPPFTINMKF